MISAAHRFLFLHVPKTGGNSIQSFLEPFSDDRRIAGGFRDGVERFELVGPVTPFKHAKLTDYAQAVDLTGYRVAMSCREPFARAVSAFFSPSRWMVEQEDGWRIATPRWATNAFLDYLPQLTPASDFIRPRETPDYLIRFEHFQPDCAAFVKAIGLSSIALPHRNKTAAPPEAISIALADRAAKAAAHELFAEDYGRFGYVPA